MTKSTPQQTSLILVGLNEINFDFLRWYADRGDLPNLSTLMSTHGIQLTTSETAYEELEPWIQWVSIQTGKSFAQHRVFRLGDIVETELPQYFELLERHGVSVGAVSPMNAANRLSNAPFFIPDPWTKTRVSGGAALEKLTHAVARVVNNNAERQVTLGDVLRLGLTYLRYGTWSDFTAGLRALNPNALGWRLAINLDRLLAALFINLLARHRPGFAALFLNAGAHIQHHYMFESAAYQGKMRNPAGYVRGRHDPLREIYRAYDDIIGRLRKSNPGARFILATGLHQDPFPENAFYWRIKDHAAFLAGLGLTGFTVEPRMSRDFLIKCADDAMVERVRVELAECRDESGRRLFEIDARQRSVFATLLYERDITADTRFSHRGRDLADPRESCAFVAIKNGMHNAVGYVIDTRHAASQVPAPVPVWSLFDRVIAHFDISISSGAADSAV